MIIIYRGHWNYPHMIKIYDNHIWLFIYDSSYMLFVVYVCHIWFTTYGCSYMTHHIWFGRICLSYDIPHMIVHIWLIIYAFVVYACHIWFTTYDCSYMTSIYAYTVYESIYDSRTITYDFSGSGSHIMCIVVCCSAGRAFESGCWQFST